MDSRGVLDALWATGERGCWKWRLYVYVGNELARLGNQLRVGGKLDGVDEFGEGGNANIRGKATTKE